MGPTFTSRTVASGRSPTCVSEPVMVRTPLAEGVDAGAAQGCGARGAGAKWTPQGCELRYPQGLQGLGWLQGLG